MKGTFCSPAEAAGCLVGLFPITTCVSVCEGPVAGLAFMGFSLPRVFLGSNGTVQSSSFQQDSMNRYGALSSQHKILKVREEPGFTVKERSLEGELVLLLSRDAERDPELVPAQGRGPGRGVDLHSFLAIQVHGSFLFILLGFVSGYSLHLHTSPQRQSVWFIAQESC